MTDSRVPAEAFPPQWYINEEASARGWTLHDLSARSGLDEGTCCSLEQGSIAITYREALGLEKAFGVDAQTWLNLEAYWQRWQLEQAKRPPTERHEATYSDDRELIVIDVDHLIDREQGSQ